MSSAIQSVLYSVRRSSNRFGVAVLALNNPPMNPISHAVRSGIVQSLEKALADPDVHALVLVGEGKNFCAGADIKEFQSGAALKEPSLVDVCDKLEASSKPVIAAIHGSALGGGLELALGCHYRIATESTFVGLPEIHLGIIPGAGGTQRLPRLVGLQKALDIIVTGRQIASKDALSLGIIDLIVKSASNTSVLIEEAIQYAQKVSSGDGASTLASRRVSSKTATDKENFDGPALHEVVKAVAAKFPGNKLAATSAVHAVAASTLPFAAGMQKEHEIVLKLFKSPESRALQHLFFSEREISRIPGLDESLAKPIRSVGVIGAGTMGGGIAMVFLNAKIPVVLLETKQEFLDNGVANIRRNYASELKKGSLTEEGLSARMGLIKPTLQYSDLKDVDMVIEAVFENMAIKKKVFAELDRVCKPDAILASNTSTLNIDEIAAATKRPEKVIGTHFFSPAHVMKLLENVRGKASSPSTIATVMSMSRVIKKVGVLVGNCEGFVGNRMLEGYAREANFMLEEGALPEQVDRVLQSFGMAMGPFQMGDLAGNDVGWRIRQGKGMTDPKTRSASEGRYCEIGDKICELGRFGQKTGAGWYKYEKGQRKAIPDPAVKELIEKHSADKGITRRVISDEEIFERCLYPLINEGFKVFEEGIAIRLSDIDIIWVYGYGFPRSRGGPMHFAQEAGVKKIYDALCKYSEKYPTSFHFKPSPTLRALALGETSYQALKKQSHFTLGSKL